MKISGIIAEYNPFHSGHEYQLHTARRLGATHIAVCMSGNFVQRGECAVISKHARTLAALRGGADLVLELPLPYAIASAEGFAFGGISILNALGCVDTLVFGAECENIDLLKAAAKAVDSDEIKEKLLKYLDDGIVFPKARELAVNELFGGDIAAVLTEPNNTLGVEYIKWLARLGSSIKPEAMLRTGAAHGSTKPAGGIASASYIREQMKKHSSEWRTLVPSGALKVYDEEFKQKHAPCSLSNIERGMLGKLRNMSADEYLSVADVSEGLHNKLAASVKTAGSLEELYDSVKSKRYTHSRIRRIVLSAYLGVNKDMQKISPPYIRVLGMNSRGAEILACAKKSCALPINTSLADLSKLGAECAAFVQSEASATDIFSLCSPYILPCGLDFTLKPVIIKE